MSFRPMQLQHVISTAVISTLHSQACNQGEAKQKHTNCEVAYHYTHSILPLHYNLRCTKWTEG